MQGKQWAQDQCGRWGQQVQPPLQIPLENSTLAGGQGYWCPVGAGAVALGQAAPMIPPGGFCIPTSSPKSPLCPPGMISTQWVQGPMNYGMNPPVWNVMSCVPGPGMGGSPQAVQQHAPAAYHHRMHAHSSIVNNFNSLSCAVQEWGRKGTKGKGGQEDHEASNTKVPHSAFYTALPPACLPGRVVPRLLRSAPPGEGFHQLSASKIPYDRRGGDPRG